MRSNANLKWPEVKYSLTRLGAGVTPYGSTYPGGFDQTTPSLALQPGALRDILNFECSQSGGYARIEGYERTDGRAAPSSATYTVVQLASFIVVPTVGARLSQYTTSASGTIIVVNNVPGAYYVVLTNVTGAFNYTAPVFIGAVPFIVTASNPQTITASNPLTVSAQLVGTAITPMIAVTSLLNAQYLAAAADVYRALIGPVPGSGTVYPVGIVFNNIDCLFAFRANVGGTAVNLYQSSAAGWVQVPFFNTVSFTAGGTATPADGETLTQGGVTATIQRVMWQSGIWTGTAVGTFVVTNPSGGNFVSGPATTTSGATVTLSGAQTAITFLPGGRFEFSKANFSGQLSSRRIYGCDGLNKAFEFDGVTVAPITTGLSPDAPSHICAHKNYLFISQASSILYPGPGTPFKWGTVDGGGEIATGDIVTGLLTLPGAQTTATLGVWMRSNTAILYGTDPTTFNYVTFNTGTGAIAYSCQNLFDTFVFDDLGIITQQATLNFGNFSASTLTKNILPFIIQERPKLVASNLNRNKSQYRAWFNDGYGLWLTVVNQNYLGAAIVQFPNPVASVDDADTVAAGGVSYFGSSDGLGYVYKLDTGTSFDGANIDAHITLAWDALKSPRILKRFRAASIEVQGNGYAQISFGYQLGYGSTNIGQPANVNYATGFAAAPVWDEFVWDNFIWDGQTLLPTDVDVTGTAENIQVILSSTTNYIAAYNINSCIYHYSMRRGMRV